MDWLFNRSLHGQGSVDTIDLDDLFAAVGPSHEQLVDLGRLAEPEAYRILTQAGVLSISLVSQAPSS